MSFAPKLSQDSVSHNELPINEQLKTDLKELTTKMLDEKVLCESCPLSNLPGMLLWQLGMTERQNGNERLTGEAFTSRVIALLRGNIAERCSLLVPFSGAHEAYANVDMEVLDQTRMYTTHELLQARSKDQMLAKLLHMKWIDQATRDRYALPDALFVAPATKIPVALCEVKSYTPSEVEQFVAAAVNANSTKADIGNGTVLGVNLDPEIEFFRLVRLDKRAPAQGKKTPVILRFCEDAPTEALRRYGQLLASKGYERVVIQQLPLAHDEMDRIALASLALQLPAVPKRAPEKPNGKREFSPDERQRLVDYFMTDPSILEHGSDIINQLVARMHRATSLPQNH